MRRATLQVRFNLTNNQAGASESGKALWEAEESSRTRSIVGHRGDSSNSPPQLLSHRA